MLAPVCNLSPLFPVASPRAHLQGDCHGRIYKAKRGRCKSLGMGAERSGGLGGGEGGGEGVNYRGWDKGGQFLISGR